MPTTVLIGAQWGDEGKGKIIDALAEQSQAIVRFHGGNNAGHTVINEYGKFPMHLVPCGIFAKHTKACITNGVILDLPTLVEEIEMLQKAGIDLTDRLYISPRCHLILPYHKMIEKVYEEGKGAGKTGTTGRGIGPTYADKVSYNGLRLSDLADKERFSQKLGIQLKLKNTIIQAFGEKALDQTEIETTWFALFEKIKQYVKEPYGVLQDILANNGNILFEGAHGMFLDNDWGTYPFVTGSNVVTGGITGSAGIAPQTITQSIGIVKAYTTRVGEGPFVTELEDADGEKMRAVGHEFGTTTGRPRRCGWLDLELIRFASQINGLTHLAITKLDVLDDFAELPICTGYTLDGKPVRYYDGDDAFLYKVKPVYKKMKGWQQSTKGVTEYEKLPTEAKSYLQEIEKQVGVPIKFVSTGPEREALIVRE